MINLLASFYKGEGEISVYEAVIEYLYATELESESKEFFFYFICLFVFFCFYLKCVTLQNKAYHRNKTKDNTYNRSFSLSRNKKKIN